MSTKAETDVAPGSIATTEELRQQARVVKEDLRGLGRTAKGVAQEKFGGAREKAAEYLGEGKKKVVEFEGQVEGYIRQKPLQSILIAAGAGVLLGFLLSRR